MYYFPFVDWINGLIKWVKQYTVLFWLTSISTSLIIAIAVKIWEETGSMPKIMLLVGIGLFVVTMVLMRIFPKKFQKIKEKKNEDSSSNTDS